MSITKLYRMVCKINYEGMGLEAGTEYRGVRSGLVDVVTKSGNNEFQGNIRSNRLTLSWRN